MQRSPLSTRDNVPLGHAKDNFNNSNSSEILKRKAVETKCAPRSLNPVFDEATSVTSRVQVRLAPKSKSSSLFYKNNDLMYIYKHIYCADIFTVGCI